MNVIVCFGAIAVTDIRKPRCHWQTRATRKHVNNCSSSMCFQRCRWQYWSIFIRLAAVASEICEIPRNSLKIQTYRVQDHPRSSILVPKRICTFLLATNSNFGRISYRFRDIDAFSSKIACFPHASIVWRNLAAERNEISTWSRHRGKVHLLGYSSVGDIIGLSSFV